VLFRSRLPVTHVWGGFGLRVLLFLLAVAFSLLLAS